MHLSYDTSLDLLETVTPQTSLARAIGLGATLYGYPLVETYRTCILQTQVPTPSRRDINALLHIRHLCTPRNHDMVAPSHDLLTSHAWLHLAQGPLALTIPASAAYPKLYFVLALFDAYTENFMNFGPRNTAAEGETVWLVGPAGGHVPDGARTVQCPTELVRLVARVQVRDNSDLREAQSLQADIRLHPSPQPTRVPWTVARWRQPTLNALSALRSPGTRSEDMAPLFFTHFCQALKEAPGRPQDQNLLRWIGQAGLRGDALFNWEALAPWRRDGLAQGYGEAMRLLAEMPQRRAPQAWQTASVIGRYGTDYLSRTLTACTGLGAMSLDEVKVFTSQFSADQQALHGRRRYTLCFEPGQWPPAEAFWSLTVYDQDQFLHHNPLGRYGIGDRCNWLEPDRHGRLVINLSHQAPLGTRNWLPIPSGPFKLVLRVYHPGPQAEHWIAPPLQPLGDHTQA